MADEEHLAILKQGAEAWNKWRLENPTIRPDFIKADRNCADFIEANFSRAVLGEANLSGAKLITADEAEC
jgi:uncharacterized protein YjbI with pentapeptide repeats